MKGSKMPPTTIAVNEDYAKTEALKYHYQELYSRWKTTLQPCEISESEMDKVITHLQKIDAVGWTTQIDVTDIVSAQVICNTDRCDGECIECTNMVLKVKFKQPTEKQVDEYGYIKCGDCNKFYLCTNCGAQCGSEGHFIEPKQVDGDLKTWYKLKNIIESELDWFEIIKSKFYIYEK